MQNNIETIVGVTRKPLVSIVIPTFNRPQYLRTALHSALQQTFSDFEIIVQDNASVVDPTPIVREVDDPRISISRNATNIGQTRNIVSACMKSRGKYVAILGDDDVWRPDFLATLVPPLESESDTVVSFCAHEYIDVDGQIDAMRTELINRRHRSGLSLGFYRPFVTIALVDRAICALSAAVFRRDSIQWDEIPSDLAFCCDNYINYLAARTGKSCYYSPARLAQVRLMNESVTTIIKSSLDGREMNSRASLYCWDTFWRDSAVAAGRRYFAMKRTDNALRVMACVLRKKGWKSVLQESQAFRQRGVFRPATLLYHLRYGWH